MGSSACSVASWLQTDLVPPRARVSLWVPSSSELGHASEQSRVRGEPQGVPSPEIRVCVEAKSVLNCKYNLSNNLKTTLNLGFRKWITVSEITLEV